MGLSLLDQLLAAGPWAFALVMCVPTAGIVIMFVVALVLAPKGERVKAIEAMAGVVRALKSGRRGGPLP
ncbi:hypothetical protein [Actinoplanes sp. NPDC049599]|uniref:hypothetical protein n=1 Tax=Actinoplanes sp. NPDC049599 TaxID=3363903 RepID=UPI0037A604C3